MAIERWSEEAHDRGVFSSRNAAREWAGYISSLADDVGAFKKNGQLDRSVVTKDAIPDARVSAVERSYKELKEHRAYINEVLDTDRAKDPNTKKLSTAVWVQVYGNPNQYILNEYAKELVKQNYNATIDDHGADFPGLPVNAPVIIFKTDEILKQIGSKKVTELDQKNARKKYAATYKALGKDTGYSEFIPNVAKDFFGWEQYSYL